MVAKMVNIGLRASQFLWTLLIMALSGNMIADAISGNPSVVNYTLFVSIISLLSLFYLIPATVKESFMIHPTIMMGVDILNSLFFFCGGIALAAELNVHSCSNIGYTSHNAVTNGAYNSGKRCREAQACTAFLWFGWVSYLASVGLDFMQGKSAMKG